MQKVKIENKSLKKQGEKDGKSWKIYEYTCEVDGQFKKMDSFSDCEIGKEYDIEINPASNPAYNDQFKLKKTTGFKGKNYDFEKRRVALETTTSLIAAGKVDMKNLVECRDKFFEYLNQ